MKITVHQPKLLLIEKETLSLMKDDLRDSRSYEKPLGFGTNPSSSDYGMAYSIIRSNNRIEQINRILATSEIIENPNTRTIQLGSVADVMVKYSDDVEFYHLELIEQKVGIESSVADSFGDLIYVSQESHLGAALLNKEIGEKFEFNMTGDIKAKGQIVSLTFERNGIGKTRLRMKRDK